MLLRCVEAPMVPPVTLAQAKAWLKVDGDEENALISALVSAAAAYLDGWTGVLGRALEEQVWEGVLGGFPDRAISLPLGPVVDLLSIIWTDGAGDVHPIEADDWRLEIDTIRASVSPVDRWPSDARRVAIRWRAGAGCPEPVRQAILMLTAHWYANREAVGVGGAGAAAQAELPLGVAMLIDPWRVTPL